MFGYDDGNPVPGWKRSQYPQRQFLFVVTFAPISHRYQCRWIDVRDIDAPGTYLDGCSHAAHDVPIDTDTQRSLLGILPARRQRDPELARQLRRALRIQTRGKLQTRRRPYLRRSNCRDHKVSTFLAIVWNRPRCIAFTAGQNVASLSP